jgi:PAS domain S-box-containing protein
MKPQQIERLVARGRRRLQALRRHVSRAGDRRLGDLLDDVADSLDAVSAAVGELEDDSAEAHQTASELAHRYEGLFRGAPDPYVVTDESGVIRELNAAAERLFGRARTHLIGKPLLPLVAPADIDRYLARLSALRDRGRSADDHPLRFGAGAGFDAEVTAIAHRSEQSVEIRWMLRDVTERRRADRALRASEARTRAALETAFDGVLGTDAAGVIVSTNAALRRMFGYRPGELEGRAVDVLGLTPEELAAISETSVSDAEGVRSDGSHFPIQISASSARAGGDAALMSSVRDLSVQRGLESQLRAATAAAAMAEERERQRLAADLHDDVGQLLSLARIKLGMLRGASGDAAERLREEAADLMMRAHQHTESLTFQLSPPILRDMGLASAAEWLAEDIGRTYGLNVHVEHDGEPPLDEATRVTAYRALRELLINIARHAKTKSAMVTMSRNGSDLSIAVEDRGVGFDCGAKLGFGLLTVRERIGALGGRFVIESEVGGGTSASMVVRMSVPPPRTHDRSSDGAARR